MIRFAAAVGATCAAAVATALPAISAAQLEEVHQRWSLAQQIVARLAPDAARMQLAPEWRQATMTLLLANSSTRLAMIAKTGGGYSQVIAGANDRTAATTKLLGDAGDDLVFKPFTPCRYMDTRSVGGKISGIRTFDLANNGASYGGSAGCDPKALAGVTSEDAIGAIAFNIAYVDTSSGAPGFLTVRPAGSTQLTAMLNWYVAAAGAQDSNAAISGINQAGPNEIEILSSGGVHVIMDLLGVFITPHATALDCTTVANPPGSSATGDVAAGTSAIFGAACGAGYTITGGGCTYFTPAGGTPAASDNKVILNRSHRPFDTVNQVFLNAWTCHWTNNDAITWRVQTRAVCCRTPGR
ncbi:MAG: hypothetical protein ABJB78_05155 [Betaproteobacteria bacterium]